MRSTRGPSSRSSRSKGAPLPPGPPSTKSPSPNNSGPHPRLRARRRNRCLPATGGVAAELAAGIMERFGGYLMAPVVRVASADVPPPFAPALESAYRPDAARICEAARNVLTY
ncbi:MAG: hypothetical protein HQ592_17000 [Planctomycetes bacterium]|nr:hypothetical protein [Planctomycetota bacterium]